MDGPYSHTFVQPRTHKPRNVSWQGRTVYTGEWKAPLDGPAIVLARWGPEPGRTPATPGLTRGYALASVLIIQ